MTHSLVLRYLRTLNQCKWLCLASFAACVGVSGAIALRLGAPPLYAAEGALTYRSTPGALLSTTAEKIQEQGKQLTQEILLSDKVVIAAAVRANVDPQQVAKNVKIELPQPDEPQIIKVLYLDTDRQQAANTVRALMGQMRKQSIFANKAQLGMLVKAIDEQLPQQRMALDRVQQQLDRYNRQETQNLSNRISERRFLKQQIELQQELLSKLLATKADAQIALADRAANLAIVKRPQVTAQSRFNKSVLPTLGMGVLGGLGFGAGLIPLLALMVPKSTQSKFQRKLLQAYKGRCAITGCNIPQALEAVKIYPNNRERSDQLSNGLILRADLKELFNAHLLAIEPVTMTVLIDPSLADTSYTALAGKPVYFPEDEASRPSINALKWHFRSFMLPPSQKNTYF